MSEEKSAEAAEPSLDELLTDFKEPEVQPAAAPAKEELSKVDQLFDYMQADKQEKTAANFETGVSEAINAMKSDDIKASDRALKGFLYTLADENPSFGKAFENRKSNPAAWERSIEWASKEAAKDYPASTDKIADDIKAAKASASNESKPETKALDNEFWNNLSDSQFEIAKRAKAAGKDPEAAVSKLG